MLKIRVDQLFEEPYATIMCYPRATKTELKKRLRELQRLGITELQFGGQKRLLNTLVLGKGCVGLVVLAYRGSEKVALKIRRTDADRTTMTREATLLKKANSLQVGAQFFGATRNFLVMQFIEGELLPRWLEKRVNKRRLGTIVRDLLEQCWRLDTAHLDHGELSHAPKHVIVDKKDQVFIIDFESASADRRPANVTSMVQFLFMSEISPEITRKLGTKDEKIMIDSLRRYKRSMNRDNFLKVLESCGL